ncbi:Cytochrome P450 709B2 [Dichanthelium oligosanthes]|uniref:Cytochrome P450 709B2 n=1 Tax=Dichanthelium oligosanthes TaxID=888268 RepID=A0A1E5VRD7_9POAL|nr:Cytochrome P450 709B2 [Dichanthelium oligosanthes]
MVAVQLAALLALLLALWRLAWRPRAVARSFARQGIRGPPYTFLAGSLPEAKRLLMAGRIGVAPLDAGCHDIMPILLPQFHRWVAEYGRTFLFWIGPIPAVLSTDLQLIKQVLTDRTGLYQKDFMIPVLKFLFGNGVILINGDDWKRHRKVVLPAFNHEKIKSMSAVTAEVTKQMMQQWREQTHQSGGKEEEAEVDMIHAFNDLTAKINGRVAFGTSHKEVEEVVVLMREMQKLATAATLDAPILWYLPTRRNLHVRRLNKQLRSKIMSIMQARLAAKGAESGGGSCGDDLLGLLLEAWTPERQGKAETLTTDEVIDECKTFFAAGQETTATLLVWAMFLLAVHPQWQDKVREEVLREFRGGDGGEAPSADVLGQLKLLHMVLLETSRLYPPIVYIQRRAAMDVILGGIKVPQGTVVSIPIAMLHRDKEVWGADADEFNPMRFEHGTTKAAKDPKALLSFSLGPRVCTGQSFGIVEVQVVMAMILRKFSFSLSPKYVHKPKYLLSLTPKLGMPLILRNIHG